MGVRLAKESNVEKAEGEARSEDESVSSKVSGKDNVCNEALHVIGLYGPGHKVSLTLLEGLGGWRQVVTWPWTCCATKCMRHGSWSALPGKHRVTEGRSDVSDQHVG